MRRIMHSAAEAMLVQGLAFEPALRAQLHRDGIDAARVEEILQEVYARLLTAAEAGRIRVRHLRVALFNILADVLAAPHGEQSVAGRQSPAEPQSLAAELSSDAGRSFTSCLRSAPPCTSAPQAGRVTEREELRRLIALAATFPAPMRQVFTLRKVYDHPVGHIARALSLSERDVEQYLIAAALACARHLFDSAPSRPEAPTTDS
jgi:DNA-directed RNA polymerase specialized sigma24 family protein